MNKAYKNLETKLRVAELTIGQWVGVLIGIMLGIGWGLYLSPFSSYLTLFTAVYLAAIPIGAAFLASLSEFNLWRMVISAARWYRSDGRYLPGPGTSAVGYHLLPDPRDEHLRARASRAADLDLNALWRTHD